MGWHAVRCFFFFAIAAGCARAQGTCEPPLLGQPCSQGAVAIQTSSEPSLNLGAGNPIHLVTGNKYQQELDLPASGLAPQLEIVRHYNALDRRPSTLGQGWTLGYDTRLFQIAGRWQIVQADGSRIIFEGKRGQPVNNRHGTLVAHGEQWVWTWPNGQALHFNTGGQLVQIAVGPPAARHTLHIRRSAQAGPLLGAITSITTHHGLSLALTYQITNGRAYIQFIDSPAGRFEYRYEAATARANPPNPTAALRLKMAIRPDGMQRRYIYEPQYQAGNPFSLTGIELASADRRVAERINSWAYDAYGRAVLSIRGGPQAIQDKLRIEYLKPPSTRHDGLTAVTNALGQVSRFHTAVRGGRHVLLRVTGEACPGCAAPHTQASYDANGRLDNVNGLAIRRRTSGHIEQLDATQSGWPGLQLRYQEDGLRTSWSSTLTGTERTLYGKRRLPIRRAFSNGDYWDYHYDHAGRPAKITQTNAQETQITQLAWQGKQLVGVRHPLEEETRRYDGRDRLQQRSIQRPASAPYRSLRYTERFDYDEQHRLIRHDLPEGGSLTYQWGPHNRLHAIDWHDAQGNVHSVIATSAGQPGYTYGNGVKLQVGLQNGQAAQLQVSSNAATVWTQNLDYDERGLLKQESHHVAEAGHAETWRYAYDAAGRLAGAQRDDPIWYAWENDGSLAALRIKDTTHRPRITRDSSGLPRDFQGYTLRYGPNRRLTGVIRNEELIDRYQHNAFGQRIRAQTPETHTDYFYLDNRLVAESRRTPATQNLSERNPISDEPAITRRYVYAHHVLVGLIDYAPTQTDPEVNADGTLYAVHSDIVGAPRLVTDMQQRIRWLATYGPTGAATQIHGDLTLNLRLPGQVFDSTTGWHDNLLRTYIPDLGHYLEPDPLGPLPANQALGYANQQPKRYVDPLGLLLFAFDGTRNNAQNESNVWKMSQRYQDGPVFYHSGPGNPYLIDWDAVTAYTAPLIIETQWQSLLNELDKNTSQDEVIPIDIIGFSRGAAMARHFGNQINRYVNQGYFSYNDELRGQITACVDLRFMGLFDTVAQFGLAGSQNANYDLTIAAAWEWVAHAVALHERRWLFPLTSIASGLSQNTIEAPFIGAHVDIGGGAAYDERGHNNPLGDLSDVALNWMLWQARAASLQFSTGEPSQGEISNPVLHDSRSSLARSAQNGDRRVDAADGTAYLTYQDDHDRLGRNTRAMTEPLIQRHEGWRRRDSVDVGSVDMAGYAHWLQNELGWQPLPA